MSDALLKISGLSAAYGDKNVIEGISFDILPAGMMSIVGESGSGKSTLIKAIHGMSGLKITAGSIIFDGHDITDLSYGKRRSLMGPGIGLIPQDPAASFNPIRKYDVQFREALAAHDMSYDEEELADRLFKIGIGDGKSVLKSRPYELSGGMNQRIAIAAAMMFEPKLLLCDEPTSALDVTTAGAVVDELIKIRAEHGTAIMMVTHHLGIARRLGGSMAIMKEGRMIEYGDAVKVFDSPESEYMKRLLHDLPRLKR